MPDGLARCPIGTPVYRMSILEETRLFMNLRGPGAAIGLPTGPSWCW